MDQVGIHELYSNHQANNYVRVCDAEGENGNNDDNFDHVNHNSYENEESEEYVILISCRLFYVLQILFLEGRIE